MGKLKLPPEIHAVRGTKGMNQGIELDEKIRNRIPFAEWLTDPESFTKEKFVEETADFLWHTYRLGSDQDRHTLGMLADQLAIYIEAKRLLPTLPLVVEINDGKTLAANPYIAIANKAMDNALKLMGELGLTPRTRLAKGKDDATPLASFLSGPKAA
jgi:phage terminase small subunit